MMPQFTDFDYFFALDVLGISKSFMSLQIIWAFVSILFLPVLIFTVFKDMEYAKMFLIAQLVYVTADAAKMALTFRWSKELGLPDAAMYFFTGAFVAPLERGLTMFPSFVIMGKLIPKGVESTMFALSNTVVAIN